MGKKILLLATLICFGAVCIAQNKFALIIANSDYDEAKTGWSHLHCANDTLRIKNALISQGFPKENIQVAYNVTKTQMQEAIDKYLVKKVKPGDIAYFHFSGHGELVKDLNGDEMNGYDQALVGIDAPSVDFKDGAYDGTIYRGKDGHDTYNGDKHFIDDDLGAQLDALRANLGKTGFVLVTIDACHSNTSTKGGPDPNKPKPGPLVRGQFFKWELPGPAEPYHGGYSKNQTGMGLNRGEAGAADMFCIYASSQNELNQEYGLEQCGSLSYAFSQAFTRANAATTYQSLYYSIKRMMTDTMGVSNTPEYEGNPNRTVLGGHIVEVPVHFFIKQVITGGQSTEPLQVQIDGGVFNSLEVNDVIGFYQPDVNDTTKAKPFVEGTVTRVNNSNAFVSIKAIKKEDFKKLGNAWAFNLTPSYTRVELDGFDKAIAQHMDDISRKSNNIRFDNNNYEMVVKQTGSSYQLLNKNGVQFSTAQSEQELFKKLEQYRRCHSVNSLNVDNRYKVSMEILNGDSCTKVTDAMGAITAIECNSYTPLASCNKNTVCEIKDGAVINFKIKNHTSSKLYFMLVELSPDSSFSCLLPAWMDKNKNDESAYNFGQCNFGISDTLQNIKLWHVTATPPGQYKLRLITSTQPFNRAFVFNQYTECGLNLSMKKYFPGDIASTKGVTVKNLDFPDDGTGDIQLPENLGVYDIDYVVKGK